MTEQFTGASRMFVPKDTKVSKAEKRRYLRESLSYNVTEDILVAMEDKGITKKELARRLSKSESYVESVLSGKRDLTLGALSNICFEIGLTPQVSFKVK